MAQAIDLHTHDAIDARVEGRRTFENFQPDFVLFRLGTAVERSATQASEEFAEPRGAGKTVRREDFLERTAARVGRLHSTVIPQLRVTVRYKQLITSRGP